MESEKLLPNAVRCTGSAVTAATPRLDAADLFAAGREVIILHAGEQYRLRLTRQDKLILTK
jgi:hemin uptake protein HemP